MSERKGKSFAIIDKIRENEFYKIGVKEGFQEGKLQERERIGKVIDKWANEYCDEMEEEIKQLQKEIGDEK